MKKEFKRGEIIIYQRSDGAHFEVTLQDETIWLTQKQIAFLFNVNRPAATKHLANIFKSGELREKSVSSKMEHTARDGKTYKTTFYNLDAIISVGYRVNSTRATQFRIWATSVLRNHILKGYTINEKRLKEAQASKKVPDTLFPRAPKRDAYAIRICATDDTVVHYKRNLSRV